MKAVKVIKIYARNARKEAEKCLMAVSVQSTLNVRVDIVKAELLFFVVEHADQREREDNQLGVICCVARVLAVSMAKKSAGNAHIVTNGLKAVHAPVMITAMITLANLKRHCGDLELP